MYFHICLHICECISIYISVFMCDIYSYFYMWTHLCIYFFHCGLCLICIVCACISLYVILLYIYICADIFMF